MDTTQLQDRDYTLIIAKTATELGSKPPGFAERWTLAQDAVVALAQQCEAFDPDGITIYVAQNCPQNVCKFQRYTQVGSANLAAVIQENYPPHRIDLQQVLQAALDDYFHRKATGTTKPNGEIILVLIDGEPSDRMAVAKIIKEATHQMQVNEELGIAFVQIGEDVIAQGFLTALDNNLKESGAKFDIVHTQLLTTIEPDSLTNLLLDSLYD